MPEVVARDGHVSGTGGSAMYSTSSSNAYRYQGCSVQLEDPDITTWGTMTDKYVERDRQLTFVFLLDREAPAVLSHLVVVTITVVVTGIHVAAGVPSNERVDWAESSCVCQPTQCSVTHNGSGGRLETPTTSSYSHSKLSSPLVREA